MNILTVAFLVVLINLPFGYWRANVAKFSRPWFLAVHIPVPFVITLRILSGLGWHWTTFPVMISALFVGQLAGGGIHYLRSSRLGSAVSSCLVLDLLGKTPGSE